MDGLIINALNYYDTNNDKYAQFFERVKYYSTTISHDDMTMSTVTFYDKQMEPIFTSRYEMIGVMNYATNTWLWAWAIPDISKNDVKLIKKLVYYGMEMDPTLENQIIKNELITSRFRVSNLFQTDIHLSIAAYLSKMPCIFRANMIHKNKFVMNGVLMNEINNDLSNQSYMICLFIHDYDKLKL